jgi:hypothetical protein
LGDPLTVGQHDPSVRGIERTQALDRERGPGGDHELAAECVDSEAEAFLPTSDGSCSVGGGRSTGSSQRTPSKRSSTAVLQ